MNALERFQQRMAGWSARAKRVHRGPRKAVDVGQRIRDLQVAHPVPLRFVALRQGGRT